MSGDLRNLRARPEDIEPNLQFELDQYARKTGRNITFSREARLKFLDFALAPTSEWKGNFRDLNATVAHMSTLSLGGRISVPFVEEEITRLTHSWHGASPVDLLGELLNEEQLTEVDLFDRTQLNHVLDICTRSRLLSEAGRTLYGASRGRKTSSNDADRLRKYLARFGLEWASIRASAEAE